MRRALPLSPGVLRAAGMLSILHLLNFLNYTSIGRYFDPPTTRSVLLVAFALVTLARYSRHLQFHVQRSWDIYLLCTLALLSAVFSRDPDRTLTYGMWLLLSVYVASELAARIRTADDVAAVLLTVFLPVSTLVAVVNVTMGPVVVGTGRHFGALGSAHVDTAYAMDFICTFLALRILPDKSVPLPRLLRWLMWGVLAWAVYQAVFGLTRSVWLGVALGFGLYVFRRSLTLPSLLMTFSLLAVALITVDYIGMDRILPEAVKGRLAVTEQRIEAGTIDPRLEGIRSAWRMALAEPQGTGYAVANSHNSYMNILLNLGWIGFAVAVVVIARSSVLVFRRGLGWVLFFAVGAVPLLLHAFFEVQSWPGQANFIPLLTWYALSRARLQAQAPPTRVTESNRYRFVNG
jgi:hypothetical protein